MGYLIHGDHQYQFEDRLLAHLKAVMTQKLLKHESFFLTWSKPASEGSGRVDLWISSSITLAFNFSGAREPELNQTWLQVLTTTSHTARGIIVSSEKEALEYAKRHP